MAAKWKTDFMAATSSVERLRRQAGETREDLAAAVFSSAATIKRIEDGRTDKIDAELLFRILGRYGQRLTLAPVPATAPAENGCGNG
jgi:transcriptional regulator with XRE-family HTH domain